MKYSPSIAALSLAVASVLAAPAFAAGLEEPVVEPVAIQEPQFVPMWAGAYIGGQAGYSSSDSGNSFDGDTWLGGLNAGWLGQTGQWAYGVEGEYNWGDDDLNGLGLLKAKGGYAPTERTLLYAVAGGAYGDFDVNSSSEQDWGWMVGAGVQYLLTDNWFLGGEVDYMDWDEFDDSDVDIDATVATVRVGFKF